MTLDVQTHCIKVSKYTDWTYQLTKFDWMVNILQDTDFNTIFEEMDIPCGHEPEIVWEADPQFKSGLPARVTILCESSCCGVMYVEINGITEYVLHEGDCETFEVEHLKKIGICCDGEEGECTGIFEIVFNPYLFVSWLYNSDIQCFIANKKGVPYDPHELPPISCREVKQKYGREAIRLTLPDWNTVTLQRVNIVKKGYIILKFFYNKQCIFMTRPILFETIDKVLLTAPKETEIKCKVLEAECFVKSDEPIIGEDQLTFEFTLSLSLYQRIMAIEKVIVEVEGKLCKPRTDL